jgi:hypothetical protein
MMDSLPSEPKQLLLAHLLGRMDDFHAVRHRRVRTEPFQNAYEQLIAELPPAANSQPSNKETTQ